MNTGLHASLLSSGLCLLGAISVLALGDAALAQDASPAPHSDSVGAAISDTAITAKVKSRFVGDDHLTGSHIKVTTTNAVVTLTGTAPTDDARSAAEDLARNVDGVKSVDDELTVGSDSTRHRAIARTERVGSDSWITTKVKSEIFGEGVGRGFDVHVKTLHGVVELSGTLPNDDAIARVKHLAEGVQGVKSVDTDGLRTATG